MVPEPERPSKRAKLLSDYESDDTSSDSSGGVALGSPSKVHELKINKEYARRFEHNSRRAELHRLEERYGNEAFIGDGNGDSEESPSSDEDEDDDGDLALGELDEEYKATLQAIRSKDPRVYDAKTTFYTVPEDAEPTDEPLPKKDKPMYLQDYHRQNLIRGDIVPEEEHPEPTYAQQQDYLKHAVVKEMHDAANEADSGDDGDDFLVAKPKPRRSDGNERLQNCLSAAEVEAADQNPEAFLSKFMEARAWVQPAGTELHPFESDDEEEEERAEAIEEAYNFRFEDPSKANETLVSHARDTVAQFSVRKDASNKRQRAREIEAERKAAEKQERRAERARLRKLRIEETQEKLNRIKEAAGSNSATLKVNDWNDLLTGDFDEVQWESEMRQKFDETYYAQHSDSDSNDNTAKSRKVKKPKWKDDIDIADLVPDFDEGDNDHFSLSSDESDLQPEPKSQKQEKRERLAARRQEREHIEQLVDTQLDLDMALAGATSGERGHGFRYRDTSPSAFGMTAKDILLASDSQLNQYAGLKKLAAFRDPDKKRRDKKRLGKKARLRQWRRETFGSERGPRQSLQDYVREQMESAKAGDAETQPDSSVVQGKKRKRSKKRSAAP